MLAKLSPSKFKLVALENDYWDQVAAWLPDVEELMHQQLAGQQVERCGLMAREVLEAGGRRVRAQLALASGAAFQVPKKKIVGWAAAVELVHNATLVHDDVQDGDTHRRGRETLWVRHGIGQAINAGDLMLMAPYLVLDSLDVKPEVCWYLTRALARRSSQTARGQAADMSLLSDRRFDWDSYTEVAEGKSGQLLGLPVEGALILAGEDPEVARRVGDLFAKLGTVFQLQDDVLDLYGSKGRARGTDLREGKVTALVVAYLSRCPEERDELLSILVAEPEAVTEEQVAMFSRRFWERGALKDVVDVIAKNRLEILSSELLIQRPDLCQIAGEFMNWIVQELSGHSKDIEFGL
jgi:geranylgeranyl diphosphate synthase type I